MAESYAAFAEEHIMTQVAESARVVGALVGGLHRRAWDDGKDGTPPGFMNEVYVAVKARLAQKAKDVVMRRRMRRPY